MTIICSWCGKFLGQKEPLWDIRVSHGVCDDCGKKWMKEMAKDSQPPPMSPNDTP